MQLTLVIDMCSCGGKRPAPPTCTSKTPCPIASAPDVVKTTPKISDLPDKISIPPDVCKQMQDLWKQSITADGNSEEHGGTLALDKNGKMVIVNQGSGGSGAFTPSTDVPDDHKYLGTFHTHPYGKNDGALDGAHAAFSGGDIGTLDDYHENLSMLQSGDNKYVLVKTTTSPSTIDDDKINDEYEKIRKAEQARLLATGMDRKQAFELASDKAAQEMAKKLNYGYYKGTDCASLTRLNPPT